MPKRHRQPEPIDITEAGNAKPTKKTVPTSFSEEGRNTSKKAPQRDNGSAKRTNTGESVVSESPSDVVFPATPSTLATDRKARLKASRAATTAMEDYGDISSSAEEHSTHSELASGEVDFDSSELGDDGNQEDDSVADILEEDSDEDGDYEAFLGRGDGSTRQGKRRNHRKTGASTSSANSSANEGASSDVDDSSEFDSADLDSDEREALYHGGNDAEDDSDFDSADDEEGSLDDDDSDMPDEDEDEEDDDAHAAAKTARRKRRLRPLSRSNAEDSDSALVGAREEHDDDEGEESDGDEGREVTVDFGIYDMKRSHIDAVMHLMDQLCPDKMVEIDRDDLGAALAENPYTYIVKVNDDGDDEDEGATDGKEREEKENADATAEVYGLASVLDVAHGIQTHPAAFKALHKLLQQDVWRSVAQGIPPAELLLSTDSSVAAGGEKADGESDDDDNRDEAERAHKKTKKERLGDEVVERPNGVAGLAKCLLLVSEYIRNVPIEVTVQIVDDLVNRVEADAKQGGGSPANEPEEGKRADAVRAVPGCMFAVLAKVQRMVEPPVTLMTEGKNKKKESGAGTAGGKPLQGADEESLDLSRYAFWREEDKVLFNFRDKRVATLSYKCRAQYEGQPEQDIPLSLFFVLQHGALRQAVAEMKRRATIAADVTRF